MSSIARPFINSASAVNNTEMIPVELVRAITPLDIVGIQNQPADYQIVFSVLVPGATPNNQVLHYLLAVDRDAALADILTTISTPVV